ncbi:MAG TPA: EAL domain-containing protein [Steroidobacteraceae bacterium]|nr:EAL domain-containing protein [Steroidobacteraceae bacterium]
MDTGPHILVVDDNSSNRNLLAKLLSFEGYRTSEAADGAEGLAIARREQPQLVISDILMPSMDGYEFVQRLRAAPATAGMRVIFCTANYHEREARSLARQAGVARVLVKPCSAPALLQAVAEVLAENSITPQPVPSPEADFDTEHLRLLTDKLSQNADTLRAANGRLAALTELNLQMASERDPGQLLQSVCTHARALLGASFAVLAIHDKLQPQELIACTSGLETHSRLGVADPRKDKGVLGRVFAEGTTLRMTGQAGQPVELGLPAGVPAVSAALAAPVCSMSRTYGWLCAGGKLGAEAFSGEDERLLTIICAQLGRIYENGSLYREVQEQATELMMEMEERARAIEQLRVSEERFRELAENIQDVFFVAGPDLRETSYVSPGYERVWGRPATTVLSRERGWMETVHPEDRERIGSEVAKVMQAYPAEGRFEFRILRPDGAVRWVNTRLFPVLDGHGGVLRTVGVTRDITDRKLAELRIVRLNRTHRVLSGISSLIVRATDRNALLLDSCRLAVQEGGFRGAWCGLVEAPGDELRPLALAGVVEDLLETVRVRIDAEHAAISVVADAMISGQPRICNDLSGKDVPVIYGPQYLQRGCRSLVALPLAIAGRPAGCFVLLSDTTGYFDDEELRLLVELADDVSFALDHIGKAERLNYLACFDPLTGLANRREFEQRLSRYVDMAAHTQSGLAVVVTDPENIEALNNTLGRASGDEILRQAAARFAAAAGGPEVVGHLGSDQFAAILTGATQGTGIGRLVEDLRHRWLGAPFRVDGRDIELGAKAGVALYPADGTTAEALLTNAVAALRNAKQAGRNISLYARQLSERMAERLALERDLRRALENGEYELHYQPKVDLARRRVHGLEALLRWRRPEHGLIPPGAFVPLLEETGMIVDVGAWALRQASLDRNRWTRLGLAAPRVAVNVSAVQLRREDFVAVVGEAVRAADDKDGLDIEVTESVLMADVTDNLQKLAAARDLGVGIALDDFGTGYSSLAYLAKLPVSVLKIDRSFVAAMLDDPSVVTLVTTVISLARSLKLESVAEGVETEEQAKILRLLGCDQIQGYLISKPLPLDGMTAFLASRSG